MQIIPNSNGTITIKWDNGISPDVIITGEEFRNLETLPFNKHFFDKKNLKSEGGYKNKYKDHNGTDLYNDLLSEVSMSIYKSENLTSLEKINALENLIKQNGALNIKTTDINGNTLLAIAALNDDIELVRFLIEQDANAKVVDKNSKSILHLIGYENQNKNNFEEIVDLLINAGADINHIADTGAPLHDAIENGQIDAVEIFLNKGANPNIKVPMSGRGESEEYTALHIAAQYLDTRIINLLIQHGADINAQDKDGNTPLHWIYLGPDINMANGHPKTTIDLLTEHGADVNIKNKNGKTFSDYENCYESDEEGSSDSEDESDSTEVSSSADSQEDSLEEEYGDNNPNAQKRAKIDLDSFDYNAFNLDSSDFQSDNISDVDLIDALAGEDFGL